MNRELRKIDMLHGALLIECANAESLEDAMQAAKRNYNEIPGVPKGVRIGKIAKRDFKKEQSRLRSTLSSLISNEPLNEIDSIQDYLFCYNFTCRPYIDVHDDGKIAEITDFNNDKVISLDIILAYCLFNFLKDDSDENRKHLHHCTWQDCDSYFISKKIDNRIKYCPLCRNMNKMSLEERRQYDKDLRYERIEKRIADELDRRYERDIGDRFSREAAIKRAREWVLDEVQKNKKLKGQKEQLEAFIKLGYKFK